MDDAAIDQLGGFPKYFPDRFYMQDVRILYREGYRSILGPLSVKLPTCHYSSQDAHSRRPCYPLVEEVACGGWPDG